VTNPDQMVVWLRDAMDAAEKEANAAARRAWSPHWEYDSSVHEIRDLNNGNTLANIYFPAIGNFSAANDPAAVLRRIAADRKILAAHPRVESTPDWAPAYGLSMPPFACETCHIDEYYVSGGGNCDTILALAEGYGWTETQSAPWPECMCTPSGECGNCWEKRQQRTEETT
jgi:hypothetical protein